MPRRATRANIVSEWTFIFSIFDLIPISPTSKHFCQRGRLNFQSTRHFRDPLIFFGSDDTIVMLNECKTRVNIADDMINLLAFFIRHDHQDAITKHNH